MPIKPEKKRSSFISTWLPLFLATISFFSINIRQNWIVLDSVAFVEQSFDKETNPYLYLYAPQFVEHILYIVYLIVTSFIFKVITVLVREWYDLWLHKEEMMLAGVSRVYFSPKKHGADAKSVKDKKKNQIKSLKTSNGFTYIGICGYEVIGGSGETSYSYDDGYLYEHLLSEKRRSLKIYLLDPEDADNINKRVEQIQKFDPTYTVDTLLEHMHSTLKNATALKYDNNQVVEIYFYRKYPLIRALVFDDRIFASFYDPTLHGEEALVLEVRRWAHGHEGGEETASYVQFTSAFDYFTDKLILASDETVRAKTSFLASKIS